MKNKKIFICCSSKDRELVDDYQNLLVGYSVESGVSINTGESFTEKINNVLKESYKILILLTEDFLTCSWSIHELQNILLLQDKEKCLIVQYTNIPTPQYLFDIALVKYADFFENFADYIDNKPVKFTNNSLNESIKILRESQKPFTIVCGAGVSYQPNWNSLVNSLLNDYLKELGLNLDSYKKQVLNISQIERARFVQSRLNIGFVEKLRNEIYKHNEDTEKTITAVAEFYINCQRVKSLLTYNFDVILENKLKNGGINAVALSEKKQICKPSEIPIYHVHGIIPEEGNLPNEHDIIFCENAYHIAYSTPYKWSNLIQIDKFMNTNCIFVGTSLTDPNMRRLLEEAHNITNEISHIAIMKKQNKLNDLIIEQNANALGIYLIWIDDFDEIENVLKEIQHLTE